MNKKLKEVALHEKDTGSSEAQIALLTDKIENLSAHMKKFKKDKHSSVGLLKAVNRRKKLLDYLKKNKHISQVISGINIVASTGERTGKTDAGWKENLSRIAEAHPRSNLAKRYGKKTIKQVKTEQVIKKHSKRIINNG